MDRATGADDIWRLIASPDVVGRPSAINHLSHPQRRPRPGRGTVLLREAIGF
jgi:hypothetical protein